jgi:hypothetical protein
MKRSTKLACVSALGLCGLKTLCGAGEVLLADSARDFSSLQGNFGWFYGYYSETYSPAAFLPMPEYSDGVWWADSSQPAPQYWTMLGSEVSHPNGINALFGRSSTNHWAVRRWQAWLAGNVRVEVEVRDGNSDSNSNGQRVWLYHNAIHKADTITPAVFTNQTLQVNLAVSVGDTIDIAHDPIDGNDWADSLLVTTKVYLLGEQADRFPSLEIFLFPDTSGLFIRWPKASYGFALQESQRPTGGWTVVSEGITADTIYYYYGFSPVEPARFFRLVKNP